MSARAYHISSVVVLVLAVGIISGAVSFAIGQSISGTSDVRIVAMKLEDGRIEFGLEQSGERILPRARFFPTDADVGRWLKSSPIGVEIEMAPPAADEQSTADTPGASTESSGNCEPGSGGEILAPFLDEGIEVTGCVLALDGGITHIEITTPGTYNVFGLADAVTSTCSVWASSVAGRGRFKIGDSNYIVGESPIEHLTSLQKFFTVGSSASDDISPGRIEIEGIGCREYALIFLPPE